MQTMYDMTGNLYYGEGWNVKNIYVGDLLLSCTAKDYVWLLTMVNLVMSNEKLVWNFSIKVVNSLNSLDSQK